MLFKVSRRFRTKPIEKSAETYVLYVKWCNKQSKSKTQKHVEYGKYESKEEAIQAYKTLLKQKERWHAYELSGDFRVRHIKQTYSEHSVSVPSVKEMTDKLPELKGIF